MGLSTLQLEAFLELSKALNFTLAAEKLHVTQSALSQRILNLEEELGMALIIRDRSGIRLTEAGTSLVRYCQIKNSLEEEFLNSIRVGHKSKLSGTVRIGGFSSITNSVILPSMAGLLNQNSDVGLQVIVDEFSNLLGLLKRGEIDYLISDDQIQKEELERLYLGSEKNVLVAASGDTENPRYLDHDENDQTTLRYLKKFRISTKNLERIYLDDIHGILQGLKLKMGKAVVPYHLVQDRKELTIIHPASVLEVPVYLYFYSQPYYSKLHEKVIEALRGGFQKYLG